MSKRSILSREEIDKILKVARDCMENGQCLKQLLLIQVAGDRFLHMPIHLEGDADAKSVQLFTIGASLHAQGLTPTAALLLSESWFVKPLEAPAAMEFAPSKHPARQEAIIIIGRSADNKRYSQVIQPFTRDEREKPVWQPLLLEDYDEPRTSHDGPTGILDYLFDGVSATS
jgi:hypothetical protein